MARTFTLEDVQAMSSGSESVSAPRTFTLEDVSQMREQAAREFFLNRETTDLSYGVRRGLRDAIDTGAELLAKGYDKLTRADKPAISSLVTGQPTGEYARIHSMNQAAREEATKGRPTTPGSTLGYIGGNTLATIPLLSAIGTGLSATGLPILQRLGAAIETGGMTTGAAPAKTMAGKAGDMAVRSGGGGIAGYITAGAADPTSANTGAMIGAATPPVLAGLGAAGSAVARKVRNATLPADVRLARDVAGVAGADVRNLDDLARMRDVLRQEGPSLIPGVEPTVPQLLQTPGASQLQRTIRTVRPEIFAERDAQQNAARLAAMERIAPVGGTPRDVAEEVGNAISSYAIPAHQKAKARVTAAFGAVDPFNESRVLLPISEMQAAKDKFLGPGTFGSGGSAQQAINEAHRIGTMPLPAVRPVAGASRQPQTLEQAVRKLGGINPNSAGGMNKEIAELGRRQSGTTGLVSSKGRTIDQVAELMHERGFLSSPDPSELLDALRAGRSGQAVYGADVADDAFRGRLDASMGDLPQSGSIPKPVSFQELQNLRSSIGEQWKAAFRSGNAKEAAALDAQRRAIDQALENLAAGKGQPGEHFAPDMVANYKEARALHAAKERQFRTGPQYQIFRQGADGQPMAQGAEIPRKFFNSGLSQGADVEAFQRLVRSDPTLVGELKRYAATEAVGSGSNQGVLSNAKFNRWLDSHSQATGRLFNDKERAILKAVAEDLKRAADAEGLGRVSGSDTMQKAASLMQLGLLDSPIVKIGAGQVPGGRFALDFLRGPVQAARAERIGGLLMEPERMGGLLDTFIATQQPKPVGLLGAVPATPLPYRGAPLLLAGGGGGQ